MNFKLYPNVITWPTQTLLSFTFMKIGQFFIFSNGEKEYDSLNFKHT